MIEVRNLVKQYGDHYAVNDISFTIEKGRIYGFLGPNGAGKTTTMNIMTGYIGLTSGQVIVNGHDIQEEPYEAKKCIGYLPEHPPVYGDMTPLEYVTFAAELKNIPAAERASAIEKAMDLTKIMDVKDRLIKNLSKGYRQRVGFAQAILGFPEVIILDEPTVGLDPRQIHEMRELIRSLGKEHTVILSSHILSEVQDVCDHIIIIHKGKLIAQGTPEELENQMRGAAMELTLKSDDPEKVRALLSAIPGAKTVTCHPARNGEVMAELEPADRNADLREAVFSACAASGCTLLMMKPSSISLESVFLELIADTGDAAAEGTPEAAPAAEETGGETE
ncbi:MAG: ABC transporter ATP-binding protein [Oscillospiraceae bacterium]|nr:ABC transporter ATP-binding protein [Oscillospiraceae bacterium]